MLRRISNDKELGQIGVVFVGASSSLRLDGGVAQGHEFVELIPRRSVALTNKTTSVSEGTNTVPSEIMNFSDQYLKGEVDAITVSASWY